MIYDRKIRGMNFWHRSLPKTLIKLCNSFWPIVTYNSHKTILLSNLSQGEGGGGWGGLENIIFTFKTILLSLIFTLSGTLCGCAYEAFLFCPHSDSVSYEDTDLILKHKKQTNKQKAKKNSLPPTNQPNDLY